MIKVYSLCILVDDTLQVFVEIWLWGILKIKEVSEIVEKVLSVTLYGCFSMIFLEKAISLGKTDQCYQFRAVWYSECIILLLNSNLSFILPFNDYYFLKKIRKSLFRKYGTHFELKNPKNWLHYRRYVQACSIRKYNFIRKLLFNSFYVYYDIQHHENISPTASISISGWWHFEL